MRTLDLRVAVAIAGVLTVVACSEKGSAPAPAYPTAPAPSAAAPARAAPPPAAPAPAAETRSARAAPAAEAPPARPAPAPAPAAAAAAPAPARPAPRPEAATHARVGAAKCKLCHRVQYDSWAASPHARNDLECEGCHGNGGDYWNASVMRDRARATAAGLVIPAVTSCKRCHPAADAALMARVHAHKTP